MSDQELQVDAFTFVMAVVAGSLLSIIAGLVGYFIGDHWDSGFAGMFVGLILGDSVGYFLYRKFVLQK